MRILELVAIRGKGGTGASVVNFARAAHSLGVEVDVVCFERSDVYKKLKDFEGIGVITGFKMARSFKPFSFAKDVVRLARLVKARGYSVVHTHSSPDSNLGLVLKMLFPHVKLVRTRHVPVPFSDGFKQRFFDRIIARSFAVYDSIKDASYGEKVSVVYDGVEHLAFAKSRSPFFTLGCVSRYAKVKGLPFFVMAVGELSGLFKFRAFIAGRTKKSEGNLRIDELKRLAERLKVRDMIDFRGFVEDVDALYAGMDVSVLTSVGSEGSSRVTLESFARGIPVVASRVGSLAELVEEGKNGFLCEPAVWREFASRFALLFSLPKLKKKFGLNAFKRADGRFRLEVNVKKMLEIVG